MHAHSWLSTDDHDKFKIIKIERDLNEHGIYIIYYTASWFWYRIGLQTNSHLIYNSFFERSAKTIFENSNVWKAYTLKFNYQYTYTST